MKIVMIHGQNHEGSTCMVAREKQTVGQEQFIFLIGCFFYLEN